MGYVNLSESLAYQSYKNSMADLWKKAKSVYDAIEGEYVDASGLVEIKPLDKVGADFAARYANGYAYGSDEYNAFIQRVASGKWLEENEGYQQLEDSVMHLNQLTSSIEFDIPAPAEGTAAREIYNSLEQGGILNTTINATIQTAKTGIKTLDELIESGTATCELEIVTVSEDNVEKFKSVVPYPVYKAMGGRGEIGYAREAMSDVFNETVVNQAPATAPEVVVNLLAQFDSDEIAASVQRISDREFQFSDGR